MSGALTTVYASVGYHVGTLIYYDVFVDSLNSHLHLLDFILAILEYQPKIIMGSKRHTVVQDRSIDAKRPLRVVCVGAGISGIITAIRFPQRIANLDLQIYEKNPDITGTWYENRYPGCACGMRSYFFASCERRIN